MALDDLDQLLAELDGIEDPRGTTGPRQSVKSQMNLAELDRLVEDFEQAKSGRVEPPAPTSPKPQPIVQPATPTTAAKQPSKPPPSSQPEKLDSSAYSWRHDAKGNPSSSSTPSKQNESSPVVSTTPTPAPITRSNSSSISSSPAPITKSNSSEPTKAAPTQPTPQTTPSQPNTTTAAPITKSNSSSASSPAAPPQASNLSSSSSGSGIGSKDSTKKDLRHSKRVSVFALKPINTSDVCGSCGYAIKGEHVVALGKIFHTNHFTCASCGLALSSDFFEYDGKPSCGPCMEKYFTCCKCGKGIEAEYFEMDGLKFHGNCLDRGTCARCGKGISSAETSALGKNYHPECFTCTGCGTKLEGTFYAKNNDPYCPRCASAKAPVAPGGLVACIVCKQQLTGTYVTFNNENYHSHCFTCAKCRQPLPPDSFYIIKQQLHCEKCAKS